MKAREHLPAFETFEECEAHAEKKHDRFYRDAFAVEAWIGGITGATTKEYAENKSGQHRLQNGVGWRVWGDILGQAEVTEWAGRLTPAGLGREGEQSSPALEALSQWLAAQYAVATRGMKGGFQKQWRLLRELCADLGELRRGEYRAARLAMEHARLKRAEEKARNSDLPCEADGEGARSRVSSGLGGGRTQA